MKLRLLICSILALSLAPSAAQAGGMFLPARGARELGRAGSFVAGADDGGAIYYNPAGLADIDGRSLLLDVGLIFQSVDYTRVDSGGNLQPKVSGKQEVLPIPTLVFTIKPKKHPRWTFAVGLWTPYLASNSYPETGPQRYSQVNINGSLLFVLEAAAAVKLRDDLWLGFGLQNMFLKFRDVKALSACSVSCAPEDPSFDSLTQLDASSLFTPSAIVGLTFARPKVRLGLSFQLPFWVRADGTVHSRLPSDPMFANSKVVGDAVSVNFMLPPELRIGAEWRPTPRIRAEIGFDYEAWSVLDQQTVIPHGVYIDNVPGVGRYVLSTTLINRQLTDSYSAHIGGEFEVIKNWLVLRAGYLFESNATPDRTLSVFGTDGLKNMVTAGLSVNIKKVRIDVGYGHIFILDRTVDWRTSQAYQSNPIQPNIPTGVGGGTYSVSADVLSLGLNARF